MCSSMAAWDTFPIGATEETLAGVEVAPIQASRIFDQHWCPLEKPYDAESVDERTQHF